MFILHITYRVFKAHASTVCKGSKQTTDTRLDTDNLKKMDNSQWLFVQKLRDSNQWCIKLCTFKEPILSIRQNGTVAHFE